jgi:ceramide glucosyltransferase
MLMLSLLGLTAILSAVLNGWQYAAALRYPLHRKSDAEEKRNDAGKAPSKPAGPSGGGPAPGITFLKPLKGCEPATRECLESWLNQQYPGKVQVLFGVKSPHDPVCELARELIAAHRSRSGEEFARTKAELVLCEESLGSNSKVSTLIQLERRAEHEIIVISDADVRVPADFLNALAPPLRDDTVGLVNPFYRLANPSNAAMRWEAVAINADFWSQVLQSRDLAPLDFALGAVMATRRSNLRKIGGFESIVDYLADDYRLGNLIAKSGFKIELCPVVVDCVAPAMNIAQVWAHQLRWARTIRHCKPVPYAASLVSNATLWPLLWLVVRPSIATASFFTFAMLFRIVTARSLQRRLDRSPPPWRYAWMPPVKDILQCVLWALSFLGHTIEWRGHRYCIQPGGRLEPMHPN